VTAPEVVPVTVLGEVVKVPEVPEEKTKAPLTTEFAVLTAPLGSE
jgi:hypothetical protein